MALKKLNLGAGRKRMQDAVNLDLVAGTGPEVVHDLNSFPWPFEDHSFDEVHAYDVIEHLGDIVKVVNEIHRISRPGARVVITVPHFSSANAFTDPTHRHYFGHRSFEYFTGESSFSFYSECRFRHRVRNIIFHPTLLNKLVWRLACKWPEAYERRWAWIFPAWYLHFELEVVHGGGAA
ncbi:MAG: class I SAM-dependent methyltransferase [Verrucomicrobia bacterium]|nr:class I SAM-dependent methyltransferase [Verrucomicrobiota bacterium]